MKNDEILSLPRSSISFIIPIVTKETLLSYSSADKTNHLSGPKNWMAKIGEFLSKKGNHGVWRMPDKGPRLPNSFIRGDGGHGEAPKSAIAPESRARTPLYHGVAFAGCPVVEINKRQINEPAKTNGGVLCTDEPSRGRLIYFARAHRRKNGPSRPNTAAWIKEMNGYRGADFLPFFKYHRSHDL